MDANGGHESAYPRPATAWWGVGRFTLGAALSYTDRQILTLLVDPIRARLHRTDTQVSLLQGTAFAVIALVTDRVFHDPQAVGYALSCIIAPSVLIAILLYTVAMLRAGHLRAPCQSLP